MRNYQHSHSELEHFFLCPYQATELAKAKINYQTRAMGLGAAMHLGAQLYGLHCQAKNFQTDLAKIPEIVAEVVGGSSLDPDEAHELADLLEKFSDQMVIGEADRFEVELRFDDTWRPVGDQETAWIGGTIDHLSSKDDCVIITDYKSDHAIPGASSPWRARYQRQLRRYAAMALQWFPEFSTAEARDHYVRYGRVSDPVIVVRGDHADILSEFREDVLRMSRIHKAEPRPGDHCHGCPIVGRCPARENLPEQIVIANRDDARRFARQYHLLKSQASQIEKGLKDFCLREGPVEIDGGRFGYFSRKENSYEDAKRVLDGLVGHKVTTWEQIWAALTVSKTAIEKVVKAATEERSKARKNAMDFCKQFLTEAVSTVFTFKKGDNGETE